MAYDKDINFIGRDALLRQLDKRVTRRFASFTLADPEPLLLGNEPIYRNNKLCGRISSGAFGHTLGKSVGLGYIENPHGVTPPWIREGEYELELAGERLPAYVSLRAPYDPEGQRVRA